MIARSFSRTFFRNAINNGLLPVECETSGIGEGDRLVLTLDGDGLNVENLTRGNQLAAAPLPPMMTDILDAGGIVEFTRRGGWGLPML